MAENKSYELTINERGQLDIIDHIEGKKRNTICIYNDLGVLPFSSAKAVCDKLNEQHEELQNLKNQIKIYDLFLDQNDLNIGWDLFCTLNYCINDEDTGCQTCKYMGLNDGDYV